jgi:hypothetical protein
MARIGLVLLVWTLAGCGFEPRGQGDLTDADPTAPDGAIGDGAVTDGATIDGAMIDGAMIDGAVIDAMPIDAMPIDAGPPCILERTSGGASAGQVGADGGSEGPFIDCGATELPVGVRVRLSDQTTENGGRSAHGFTLICATVAVSPTTSVTSVADVEILGNGNSDWSPSTQSPAARCPDGWIVHGLVAHRGASDNLFSNVSFTCARIAADASVTSDRMTVDVANSGQATANRDEASCTTGVVVRADTRRGAGIDAVSPMCSALRCQ